MEPEVEAKSKITRIDKNQNRQMQQEDEDVVRARYLMSPFNLHEAKRHKQRTQAAAILAGALIVGFCAAMFFLTLCSKQ